MGNVIRFGRKLPLRSTIQLKHELLLMTAAQELSAALDQEACSPEERIAIVGGVARDYHLSRDRAEMLVDQFGSGMSALGVAAQGLQTRKDTYGAP